MLLHARFFSAALLSVEDVAQSTLTLGGAGGLNSAYMHPPTLETFKEIDTTRPAFSSDPWTLFSTLHLKVSLSVLFHNSALVGTFRSFPNWGRKSFPKRSHHEANTASPQTGNKVNAKMDTTAPSPFLDAKKDFKMQGRKTTNQIWVTSRSHPGRIQVTSRSHPGHIQVMQIMVKPDEP